MSCGVGCSHRSDLVWLRLWHRLTATAPIQPLAWEPPYAAGAAQEIATTTTTKRQKTKRQKKKKKKKKKRRPDISLGVRELGQMGERMRGRHFTACLLTFVFWNHVPITPIQKVT